MRIVFLAANDPIYLPRFFDRVLSERARSVAAVFAVPPLYKGQSSAQAAWRYFRTFGAVARVGRGSRLQVPADPCQERRQRDEQGGAVEKPGKDRMRRELDDVGNTKDAEQDLP